MMLGPLGNFRHILVGPLYEPNRLDPANRRDTLRANTFDIIDISRIVFIRDFQSVLKLGEKLVKSRALMMDF